MTEYLAVMADETGCEFSVEFEAYDRSSAYFYLAEQYPESSLLQLESPDDRRRREYEIYCAVNEMYEDPY